MKKIDYLLLFLALLGVGVIIFALMYEIYATHELFAYLSHTTHFIQT